MSILDRTFHYTNSADSAKPGYLRRKFERIRREQRESQAKREAEVAAAQAEVASIEVEQQRKVRTLR